MPTQKELIEQLVSEISVIKRGLPNGELTVLKTSLDELKESVSKLEYRLLNPDDGIIVETNKNSWHRKQMDDKIKEHDEKLSDLDKLIKWKENVQRALWVVYSAIIGMIIKISSCCLVRLMASYTGSHCCLN